MSPRRLWTLIRREVQATFRDRFTVAILVVVPIFALAMFGFVLTTDVEHLSLGLFDAARSAASRRIAAELAANGTFDVQEFESTDAIGDALVRGHIQAGLVIPPDFDDDRRRPNERPRVQVLYDAAETPLAGNVEASIQTLLRSTGAALVQTQPQRIEHPNGISVVTRAVFNPKLDGKPFMVAGTFGFVLSFLTTLITAVSIVNEKLQGTFEQLQVTPATSLEIVLGKLLPLGAVFALDVALMALIAGVFMGVWPRGSLVFFLLVSAVYVLISLALGLLISATSKSAAEAVQRSVIFSIPLVQLSGFIFPVRNMPTWLQLFPKAFPATHYIAVSRAIYMRGDGPTTLWPELLFIFGGGVVLIAWAVRSVGARA